MPKKTTEHGEEYKGREGARRGAPRALITRLLNACANRPEFIVDEISEHSDGSKDSAEHGEGAGSGEGLLLKPPFQSARTGRN
jgi:hypothetical protein